MELPARTSRATAARPSSNVCDQPSATIPTDTSRATRSTCSPGTAFEGVDEEAALDYLRRDVRGVHGAL
jgi:hypothetical protein